MLPPHSESKNKTNKKPARKQEASTAFMLVFLGLLFEPEDGEDIFLQNIS
jgi:hypothetical protein